MQDTQLYKLIDLHLNSLCSIQFIFTFFFTFDRDVSGLLGYIGETHSFIWHFVVKFINQRIKTSFFKQLYLINQGVLFSSTNCLTFYSVHAITGRFPFSSFRFLVEHIPLNRSVAGSVCVPSVIRLPSIASLLWPHQYIFQLPFYCWTILSSGCVWLKPLKRRSAIFLARFFLNVSSDEMM